jgi:RNA polymerase sigma-70 factor (ECF subfamily)
MKVAAMSAETWPADTAGKTDIDEARRRFPEWVRTSRDSLYATLLRIVRSPDAAEDLLQDTYLRALSRLDGYRGEGEPEAWLRRIAVRLALNHLRGQKLRRWLPLSTGGGPEPGTVPEPAAPGDGPDASAATAQRRRRLETLLAKHPAKARAAFVLRHLEGRSYREIADLVGGSEATVRSTVSRVSARLEREIEKRGWHERSQ